MKQPIKITKEELDAFNKAKTDIQLVMFKLGELYLEKMEMDHIIQELSEKEKLLREDVVKIKKDELALMDNMLKKYGEGNLSLEKGEFTPN